MSKVVDLLGDKTSYYLDHTCKTIDKSLIYIPCLLYTSDAADE